jgi:hypothetical protein
MCKQVNDKKSRSGGKPSIQTMVAVARDATVILGLISAAVGIAMSAYTYTATQWRKDAEQKRSQLSTYSTYGQYLKKYQDTIQPSLGRIMADGRYKALLDGPTRDMKCGQIISEETETQTGLSFGDLNPWKIFVPCTTFMNRSVLALPIASSTFRSSLI